MKKLEQLYEGKAKKVFATEDPDIVIVDYKDDATAFNGEKKGTIVGKGVINNRMTNYVFQVLEKEGVPTHFVEELSDRETAVKKVEIVPLEVIVRNVAAGSFSKRLGIEEGKKASGSDFGIQLQRRRSRRSDDQRLFCDRDRSGYKRRDRQDYGIHL